MDIEDTSIHSNSILKLYYIPKLDWIALTEENKRCVKFYDAYTLELIKELNSPKSVVSDLCFIPKYSYLVILASDRRIYFHNINEAFELHRQFETSESQISLVYSQFKGEIFSYGLSAKIYGWNVSRDP